MPVFESGRVTLRNADQGLAPRSRAASRWLRSIRSSAAKSGRGRDGVWPSRGGEEGQDQVGDVAVDEGEDDGRRAPPEPVPRLTEHVRGRQEVVHPAVL